MELESLTNVSDNLIDKLLNGVVNTSNFFTDIYRFNSAKKNYLDKIAKLQYVRTINEFEETVSLYEFFVAPHLANVKDKNIFKVSGLSDIKAHRKILISGIVGQGKSVLMRHLAISEVLDHNKIPLFFELRYLEKGQNLDIVIKKIFEEWLQVKSPKIIEYILSSGLVTLFFDGFDEIYIEDMPKIIKGFESLVHKYPKLNFIVSSRPEHVVESCALFQNFQIQKLDFSAQKNIIMALIKSDKMQKAVIDGIEKSNIAVKEALITPLMVNLFVFIYKQEQIVPEHVKDFYDRLFDLVLRKHDNTKVDFKRERATKLDNLALKKVLQLISFMCCKQQVFAFDEHIFRRLVDKAITINDLKCNVDQLIFDLTSVLCFIVKEGYLYAFIHKSIPEYFAAEFIRDHGDAKDLYEDIYNNYSKYEKVCIFLNLIDEYNYNLKFLKRVFLKDIDNIKSKKFIDRSYILIDPSISQLKIVFDENIHEYFKCELLNRLSRITETDIVKNFKYVDGLQITISNRRLADSTGQVVVEQNGVYTDYFDSVSDNTVLSSTNSKDLEKELRDKGYRKINAINLKNKFYNTLIFLNSFVNEVEQRQLKIEKIINRYEIDDYSF
ncbi:hypothetical protein B9T26_04540 [Acinetobacter sp. ANC 4169]|uniref:NACHT domain-containing protein n=1 Tax=Acinetobacter sp. ANC 4169 TaxID=1977879 RepID=UPI000A34850C|nr:NACHT domain-containing protein [Acinetobacter sp. ANC 4169]OTG75767.1 hypothetical protein B9T26_04540 [Acinetobacter sp. ANC 4169]